MNKKILTLMSVMFFLFSGIVFSAVDCKGFTAHVDFTAVPNNPISSITVNFNTAYVTINGFGFLKKVPAGVTVQYYSSKKVASARAGNGYVKFTYQDNGKISTAFHSNTNRTIKFNYYSNGKLSSIYYLQYPLNFYFGSNGTFSSTSSP